MNLYIFTTLATQTQQGGHPFAVLTEQFRKGLDILMRPNDLADALSQINVVWAGVLVTLGIICTFQGYRWRKTVVLVLAALCGLWAGSTMGGTFGDGGKIAALALAVLFAIVALPLMKFTVAFFGGLAGAFLGANIWSLVMPPDQAVNSQLGAVIGLIIIGMLAFIAFRMVVIVFTSIIGATMLMLGSLSLMIGNGLWGGDLHNSMSHNELVVPLITAVIALSGGVIQQGGGFFKLIEKADDAEKKPEAKPVKA